MTDSDRDVLLRGGLVVDGTGSPGIEADVLVRNGRIETISPRIDAPHAEVVGAEGHVVCPGFIDIHTHYDAQVFWDPHLTPSSFHGVTTVVMGNCGFGLAPIRHRDRELVIETLQGVEDMSGDTLRQGVNWTFESFADYLRSLGSCRPALNVGAYIGHTALRIFVLGEDAYERVATDSEIAQMCTLARQALEAGAMGLSTSLSPTHVGAGGRPVPSRLASGDEILRMFSAVAATSRGLIAIVPGGEISFRGVYELQRRIGAPMTMSAILTAPDGSHRRALAIHREAWERGSSVYPQVTSRPLTFQFSMREPMPFNQSPAFAELSLVPIADRRSAYVSRTWRGLARKELDQSRGLPIRWDTFAISEAKNSAGAVGESLSGIANDRGSTPFDTLLDLAVDEPDLNLLVTSTIANDDQAAVDILLRESGCVLGLSDAGAHVSQLCDAVQATDFLGSWVRDRNVMSLEAGVRKLTGELADLLCLPSRGYLREGFAADITIFDPQSIQPGPARRVQDFPADGVRLTADAPKGIKDVYVNGIPIRREGEQIAMNRPGRIVAPCQRPRSSP